MKQGQKQVMKSSGHHPSHWDTLQLEQKHKQQEHFDCLQGGAACTTQKTIQRILIGI